jgi:GGDEF domain-containing protein
MILLSAKQIAQLINDLPEDQAEATGEELIMEFAQRVALSYETYMMNKQFQLGNPFTVTASQVDQFKQFIKDRK